jgi:hypothetical protein
MPTATQSEELVVWRAEAFDEAKCLFAPYLFAPVSDASLQHKNCLVGREFGKPPFLGTVSLSQSHDGALAFPAPPPSPTRKPAHRGYLIPCSRARISEMRRTKIFGTGTVNYQPALALGKLCRIRMNLKTAVEPLLELHLLESTNTCSCWGFTNSVHCGAVASAVVTCT